MLISILTKADKLATKSWEQTFVGTAYQKFMW